MGCCQEGFSGGGGGPVVIPTSIPIWSCGAFTFAGFSDPSLQKSVTAFALPAKGMIHELALKTSILFTGGAIATYLVSVGVAGDLERYLSLFDVKQAVSDNTFIHPLIAPSSLLDYGSPTNILITAYATGANLDQAVQGTLSLCRLQSILP